MTSLQTDISFLTEEQLPDIMVLQDKVIAVLEKPEFLQPLTEDEFLNILRGNGMMAGAFVEGRLIAFRAMLDPGDDEEHLGVDAGIPKNELSSVLYSEVSCVDPKFRGNGLQTTLGKWLLERVDTEHYRYICSTVAPLNIPSLKDKFALGLRIGALKIKYGEKLRYILFRDLRATVQTDQPVASTVVLMNEIVEQQQLLKEGWIGSKMERRGNNWYAVYVK
ncbi:GNAT family N-acetyltransferase [Sporosarcina sp.]|uniref:GNAT family N-acetyltransferase n=1 Tax=Sporosarcina sp. TaxID=49982 RepID=UPI00261FF0BC|nr:GNAT family N-acetyltransferase [Sporosarcina sp.]